MSKENKTFKEKKVYAIQVKTLLPYSIIVIAASVVVGFILGSQYQIHYQNDMQAHAAQAISSLKEQK